MYNDYPTNKFYLAILCRQVTIVYQEGATCINGLSEHENCMFMYMYNLYISRFQYKMVNFHTYLCTWYNNNLIKLHI